MRLHSKLMLAGLAAALVMATAVSSASANRLSISHGNLYRVEWSSLEFGAVGIAVVRCAMTIEGSFHSSTIAKTSGALIGYITHASIKNNPCILGSATILSETLPWHVQYRGFRGTLPNISGWISSIVGASFRIQDSFGPCLATSTATQPIEGITEEVTESGGGNRIFRRLVAEPAAKIACTGVEGGGNITGEFKGAGVVREVPGGSINVLIRLI